MYLIREILGKQLTEIGECFGGRDHSTVIHSLERVNTSMEDDPDLRTRIGRLKTLLETMRN